MELCITLICTFVYLLIAIAFWVDVEARHDDRVLHTLACIVWPVVVVFALTAVAADAALAVFRRR